MFPLSYKTIWGAIIGIATGSLAAVLLGLLADKWGAVTVGQSACAPKAIDERMNLTLECSEASVSVTLTDLPQDERRPIVRRLLNGEPVEPIYCRIDRGWVTDRVFVKCNS